ncbi:hypothetical protein E2K80_08875 [Rhodophyticola sp. CCM32]|uniref:HU family DNA-binding protein n=1 Tax=Rhodophyticola sp. CCM32 TaxID=2916397 RepID=UPI00107FAB27|nr:HU family DNA-binding protein [Rhodophyticola sp. CCM32]QBY00823.1 hypothetical protein E2K80_08875 [Rhodophyticola sp. CCM32]
MATAAKPRKSTPAGRRPRKSPATASAAKAKVKKKEILPVQKRAAAAQAEDLPDTKPEKFKRGDLINAVAARSPVKRSDLRLTVELVLDELGKALDSGKDLVIPPLGKITVKRRNPAKNGDILVSRIKLHKAASEGLADEGEDS